MNTNSFSPLTKYILGWLPLPGIAIFNGILRELTYRHIAGEQLAQQISAILLSLLIMLYAILLNSRIQLKNFGESLTAGLVWLVLTITFETGLGLAMGTPLNEQLESYNLLRGNFWPLVLFSVLLSPIVFRRKGEEKRLHGS